MTLPEPILSFWMASLCLHARVGQTEWGAVVTDPRYPRVYEANHASVLRPAPDLTLQDIRSELIPALEQAAATHEHIEIMDADDDSPALRELLASPGEHDPDVVMIYEEKEPAAGRQVLSPVPDVVWVEEVAPPDDPFWDLYRLVPNEYGETLPDDVLDQMLARVRDVFVPAGQWFLRGKVDGQVAGVVSVLPLEGVAYIDNVVTLPPFRGRGIATVAVARAVSKSIESGAEVVFLLAEANGAAQRLYERLGFRVHRRCYGFTPPLHEVG
jgi:ribosomal protein S18 acetylase RimI-like enzyme